MIQLRLLGNVALTGPTGEELSAVLRQPKRLALLAYLAVASPRGFHRRDTLLALFWPERDAEHARAALSHGLYTLRRALGEGVIVSRGDEEVGIDPERCCCDAVALEEAVDAGRFEEAVELYRGQLLAGFHLSNAPEFDRWLEEHGARVLEQVTRAAWTLADQQEAMGHLPVAARWARHAVRLSPYEESGVRRLMTLLERTGNRAEAVHEYERFARHLASDLEVEPSTETVALIEGIRAGRGSGGTAETPPRLAPEAPATDGLPPEVTATPPVRVVQPGIQPRRGLVAGLALLVIAGWALWVPPGGDAPEIRRLAVLPLANLTGDPQRDFFVAGLHDALVTELSRISELTVISRQSTLRYRGSHQPVPAIARELGVDALLEGSVNVEGDSVRITAQLVRAKPEERVWADTYRVALRNALALQSEVAGAVARVIHARATPGVEARLAARPPVSTEAQEAYLKGLYHLERQAITMELSRVERQQTLDSAIAYLERAVALAPGWATAHAKLARAYHWVASSSRARARILRGAQGETGRTGSPAYSDLAAKFYPKAKASALRALELDESEPVAHAALGFVLFNHEWDWVGAEREIQRALALDPNSGQWTYALYLVAAGRYEEALAHYKLAEERYPLSPLVKVQLAETYSCAGRHDEAIAELEELQARLGDAPDWLRATLGKEYLAKSMHTEAITELEQAVALSDSEPGYVASLADVLARAGRVAEARKLLSWLEERSGHWWAPQLYIALGDTARAVAMVQTAFEERPDDLVFLRCFPAYPALRGHPRVQEIVRRINFPPDEPQTGIVVR
jgi:TolB-like protein/DNA-binding SARP family transcriptional activator/Flp pilus assembly protein TadD